jgi:hypothetical protein
LLRIQTPRKKEDESVLDQIGIDLDATTWKRNLLKRPTKGRSLPDTKFLSFPKGTKTKKETRHDE